MNAWQDLANAVVLQAVEDYRMSEDPRDREEIEGFFRSDWFKVLTRLDPEELIAGLRKEKMRELPPALRGHIPQGGRLREGVANGG